MTSPLPAGADTPAAPGSGERSGPRSRAARLVDLGSWLGVAGLLLAAALCASARWFWLGEVATSFRWQLGLVAGLASLVLFATRAWRRGLLACALLLWGAGPEGLLALGAAPASDGRPTLTVMSANVLWSNEDCAAVLDRIAAVDPDVLVLLELSQESAPVYEAGLHARYPWSVHALDTQETNGKTWEVELFSKRSFEHSGAVSFDETVRGERPAIEVTVAFGDTPVTIQAIHAPRAGRAWRNASRDQILETLATRPVPGEHLLVGDLDITSTSPEFDHLLAASGLRDSRAGFGRQGSWNVTSWVPFASLRPFLSTLGVGWIAIDHALVSGGLDVVDRRTVTLPGSDHHGNFVVLARR